MIECLLVPVIKQFINHRKLVYNLFTHPPSPLNSSIDFVSDPRQCCSQLRSKHSFEISLFPRSTADKSQLFLPEIYFKVHVSLHAGGGESLQTRSNSTLASSSHKRIEALLLLDGGGETGALVDELLGRGESEVIPASNSAGKPIDKAFELRIRDGAIDPLFQSAAVPRVSGRFWRLDRRFNEGDLQP